MSADFKRKGGILIMELNNIAGVTQETINQVKKGIMGQYDNPTPLEGLAKAYTTGTGLVGYNLEAPAKQLVPFLSPMRNRIPRKVSKTGTSTNWKVIQSVNADGKFTAMEGKRGNSVTTVVADKVAIYKTFGLQDSVTLEAIAAGRGFQDPKATAATNLLLRVMTNEEQLILGGNITTLGTVSAPTLTPAGTGGTIPAGTYSIKCAVMTMQAINRVVMDFQTDSLLAGVPAQDANNNIIANALDGVSAASPATSTTALTGTTSSVVASVTPVKGAFGYAWFMGTAGNETLQCVTAASQVTLIKLSTGGTPASAVTVDGTADQTSYEGMIPQIVNGQGYYRDMNNTAFTGSKGGVNELDEMNMYFFRMYKTSPTRYLCGAQAASDITNLIVAGSGAPLLLVNNNEKANITGNYLATKYINKAMNGQEIIIEVHPWLPTNMLVAVTENIPYINSQIPSAFEIELGYDYMQLDYAMVNPKHEFEIRGYGALKCYFPKSCGVITNFKPVL